MKKLIVFILAAGWFISSYSQEIIQLEETELTFEPTAKVVFEDYRNGIIRVKENYATQFQSDAVRFLKENFDIHRFIEESGEDNVQITVTMRSKKGLLMASYDGDGNLLKTFQKFKNVPIPAEVRNQVYAQYKNWELTKSKYIASGMEDKLDKEKYLLHLRNGKDREKLKITPASASGMGVATIEKY